MTGTILTAISATHAGYGPRASATRVANACGASDLRDHAEERDAHSHKHPSPGTPHDMSHRGTDARTPLWNGPRLSPAFVAQLLGQVMPSPEAPVSAAAVYDGAAALPLARLLERRV
jgi:hypothetical protein